MPALRTNFAILTLKISFGVIVWLAVLELAVPAQSSLNEIHIAPRGSVPVDAFEPAHALRGSMLHIIKSDARLVLIPVSVTDPKQRLVTGLHEENFEVFEGKKPQPIRNFSVEDSPVSIGIILDSSGSMADKMERVRKRCLSSAIQPTRKMNTS